MTHNHNERLFCSLAEAARRSIHHQRIKSSPPEQQRSVVRELRLAITSARPGAVAALLDPQVQMLSDDDGVDGGANEVRGVREVADRMRELLVCEPTDLTEQDINGRPGLVMRRHGFVVGVVCVDVVDQRITDVWVVLDPTKLRHWN